MAKNRIKELRLKTGITQAKLAEHLGIAQNTLSYWEQGKFDPDSDSFLKIADFFNISVDYLFGREDKKSVNDCEFSKEDIERYERIMALPPDKRNQILDYLDFLLSRQESE